MRCEIKPLSPSLNVLPGPHLVLVDSRAGAQQEQRQGGALKLFTHLPQEVAERATCRVGETVSTRPVPR
jgi:hypothetical protein